MSYDCVGASSARSRWDVHVVMTLANWIVCSVNSENSFPPYIYPMSRMLCGKMCGFHTPQAFMLGVWVSWVYVLARVCRYGLAKVEIDLFLEGLAQYLL